MEMLVVLAVALGAWVFFVPLIAFWRAGAARRRVELMEAKMLGIESELFHLRKRAAESATASVPVAVSVRAPVVTAATVPVAAPDAAETLLVTGAAAVVAPPASPPTQPAPAFDMPAETFTSAPLSGVAVPVAAASAAATSLEEKIALVWFTRIGAAALLLGLAYFFKYAVDNEWIGPWGRVALGALVGAGLLVAVEALRERTKAVWLRVISGVGLGFLLFAAYASSAFYHLVPSGGAFAAFFIITLLGGALSLRHRAESTLVVSLAAALAAPVLLSTGVDRPGSLFLYLGLVTCLSHAVALKCRFRIAAALGIVGTIVLFAGWYEKFFAVCVDCSPPGHYVSLVRRVIPGLGVLGFSAEWLVLYSLVRAGRAVPAFLRPELLPRTDDEDSTKAPGEESPTPRVGWEAAVLLVVAAVAAHGGAVALLFDHPVWAASVLAGLGAPFVYLFVRDGRHDLLAVPLVVSFALLMGVFHGTNQHLPPSAMAMLSVWAAIYALAIARGPRRLHRFETGRPLLLGLVALAFVVLSGSVLIPGHLDTFVGVVAAVSAFYLFAIKTDAGLAVMRYAALAVSGLALLAAKPSAQFWLLPDDQILHLFGARFMGACAAWAAVYIAAVAWDLFRRRANLTRAHVIVSSAAGLAFLTIVWQHAAPHVSNASLAWAGLFAAVGVIDFAFGALALRSLPLRALASAVDAGEHPFRRKWASLWLAEAMALFAASLAFLFTGPVITISWVFMAATVAAFAARERERDWLFGAAALWLAAAIRLFAVDWPAVGEGEILFAQTFGASGTQRVPFLLNGRAYATVAVAGAGLLAARQVARVADIVFQKIAEKVAAGFLLGAHMALLALFVTEAQTLALPSLPRAPAGMDADSFAVYSESCLEVMAGVEKRFIVVTTLVMGLYAAGLLGIGFGLKEKGHRYLGLVLFVLTIAKLALWDVWSLPRVDQILILAAVGALLLGASFLYARFGKRLLAILRQGTTDATSESPAGPAAGALPRGVGPGGVALLLIGLGLPGRAHAAFDAAAFRNQRAITGVNAAGLYRLEVDPQLYRLSLSHVSDPWRDLRVLGPQQEEVPFLVRPIPIAAAVEVRTGVTLVDPVSLPGGGAQAVFDLGKPGLRHSQLRVEIESREFLRHVRVERSDDERRWGVLVAGGVVYRVTGAEGPKEDLKVAYPASDARYVRVTLEPGGDGKAVRITGAELAFAPPESIPLRRGWDVSATRATTNEKERAVARSSSFDFDLGQGGVPVDELILNVSDVGFERRVDLSASDQGELWIPLTSAWIFRALASGATHESVSLSFAAMKRRYLRVTVHDEDNPALHISGGRVTYPASELVFDAQHAGEHRVLVGAADVSAPEYDLAAVLRRRGDVPALPATLGVSTPNPVFGRKPPAAPLPFSERHRGALTAVLAALLVGLLLWSMKLMRRPN